MASFPWKNPTLWRVISVAGATTVMALPDVASSRSCNPSHKDMDKRKLSVLGTLTTAATDDPVVATSWEKRHSHPSSRAFFHRRNDSCTEELPTHLWTRVMRLSTTTKMEGDSSSSSITPESSLLPMKDYDFVIVGHGIAGKSAVETLQKLCPQAPIAVVDPMLQQNPSSSLATTTNNHNNNDKVDYYFSSRCEGFHPLTRQVQIVSSHPSATTKNRDTTTSNIVTTTRSIRYQHSILLATGSRGAPPPHYLLDDKALGRVLELRPTIVMSSSSSSSPTTSSHKNRQDANQQPTSIITPNVVGRPLWDPAQIRQTVLQAARRGDTVAILGSGWDAVEMALAISAASKSKSKSKSKRHHPAATLVFGGKGPLSHVLPLYLSAALAKRLTSQKHTIPILDRSLIRYIGTTTTQHPSPNEGHETEQQQQQQQQASTGLELFTAKSYDFLDGSRTAVQWLVGTYLHTYLSSFWSSKSHE
jgi:Pyridine nucleotide-disulphide oxidoreductase